MKTLLVTSVALGLATLPVFGQYGTAMKRVRELNNQNNVRQGVTPPAQAPKPPPAAQPAAPATAKPVASDPAQNISKISADLTALKAGTAATPEQKQQLIKDIAVAVRGTTKPSLPTVTTFANNLTGALADKGPGTVENTRLAQDIEAVVNSTGMQQQQFDAVIADAQAILQVGGVKRNLATSVASDLKAVGAEVRRAK